MKKLRFLEIGFEKLRFRQIILEVARRKASVVIVVLKKKLGLNGDGFWKRGCGFDLKIMIFETR